MKTMRLLTVVLALIPTALLAQKKDEQAVAEAVRLLNQGMIDANHITLDQLTSDKLSYGHSNGLVEDKNTFITAIIDGTSRFTSIDLTEQTIAISDDTAIIRHKLSGATHNKGQQPGAVNLAVMQVWQKQKGRWLLLARQATKI